jgi:hypothetical protein
MIGMMYLVLTAMLALNVSADILNGFDMVNNSLSNAIINAEVRNRGLYGDMQALYDLNPTKVGEWLEKANKVKEESDRAFNYIQDFKKGIILLGSYIAYIAYTYFSRFSEMFGIGIKPRRKHRFSRQKHCKKRVFSRTKNGCFGTIYLALGTTDLALQDNIFSPWDNGFSPLFPFAFVFW